MFRPIIKPNFVDFNPICDRSFVY